MGPAVQGLPACLNADSRKSRQLIGGPRLKLDIDYDAMQLAGLHSARNLRGRRAYDTGKSVSQEKEHILDKGPTTSWGCSASCRDMTHHQMGITQG